MKGYLGQIKQMEAYENFIQEAKKDTFIELSL